MTYYWLRRGYGAFVLMPSETKARARAKHWHEHGGGGNDHPVIGLFIGSNKKYPWTAKREELYNGTALIVSETEVGIDR